MVNKNTEVLVVDENQTAEQASYPTESPPVMNAIAVGVEAKLDPFSAYSKIVAQRTIGIAQQLGVAEEEIQRWAMAKAKLESERKRTKASESVRS